MDRFLFVELVKPSIAAQMSTCNCAYWARLLQKGWYRPDNGWDAKFSSNCLSSKLKIDERPRAAPNGFITIFVAWVLGVILSTTGPGSIMLNHNEEPRIISELAHQLSVIRQSFSRLW